MDEHLKDGKILVLWNQVMTYTEATLETLAKMSGLTITVVRRNKNTTRNYVPKNKERVFYHSFSEFDQRELLAFYNELKPRLLLIAGWETRSYLAVAHQGRIDGIPVVSGLDNQWRGTVRQKLACLLARRNLRSKITHFQVAGKRQYEFARRLGYADSEILDDLYSADPRLFRHSKDKSYPKRLLYVGRFHRNKGLDILREAWTRASPGSGWELVVVGSGPDLGMIDETPGVTIKSFMQPQEVVEEAAAAGAFVLPSRFEPWGVVVQEFAAMGFPLILSSACGAGQEFLIHGYNGWAFRNEMTRELETSLRKLFASSEDERRTMGERSAALAKRITPETSAANLLSILFRGTNY